MRRCNEEFDCLDARTRNSEGKQPCPECGQLCGESLVGGMYWCRTHGHFEKGEKPICPKCGKLASFTTIGQDDIRIACPTCGLISHLNNMGAKQTECTKALTKEQYYKIQNEIDGDFHRSGPSYLLSILGKHYELGVKNDGTEYLIRERKTYYDEPETIASFAGFDEMFSFLVKLNNGTKREPPRDDKDTDKKNQFGSDEEKLPCPDCGQLCSYNSVHALYWCGTHGYFSKNARPICPEREKPAEFSTFGQDDIRGNCQDCELNATPEEKLKFYFKYQNKIQFKLDSLVEYVPRIVYRALSSAFGISYEQCESSVKRTLIPGFSGGTLRLEFEERGLVIDVIFTGVLNDFKIVVKNNDNDEIVAMHRTLMSTFVEDIYENLVSAFRKLKYSLE